MRKRQPLTPEERAKSYAKYYDLDLTPVPEDKLQILADGPMDPADALSIENRADLFDPGYLAGETGYCIMPDGTGFLANHTLMPDVTPEMFEWWFAWHALDDLRYKIWDPEDHFYARAQNREKALDASLPMRERTWGVTHDVFEDIGGGPDQLMIHFKYPSELGYPEELVGTDRCATMMAANGGAGEKTKQPVAAVMTHFVREMDKGIELRSRFWIGYNIVDGQPVKLVPDGVTIPEQVPRGLFAHNLVEFTHLGAILPLVYAEEKNNW